MAKANKFEVPGDYHELQRQFGGYVDSVLLRHNKIGKNHEDIRQYIWVKLLEAQILERFQSFLGKQLPKVVSALDACDILGVTWAQWVTAMSRQDQAGAWLPRPVNLEEYKVTGTLWQYSPTALFMFSDILALSEGVRLADGSLRRIFLVQGQDVRNGKYLGPSRPDGILKLPLPTPTMEQFRNYLTTAVLNHFANFCRTEDRRHKERPVAAREDGQAWESTLPGRLGTAGDLAVVVKQAKEMLATTIKEVTADDGQVADQEQIEIVFLQLEQGEPIMRALRKALFSPSICQTVIDTLHECEGEF